MSDYYIDENGNLKKKKNKVKGKITESGKLVQYDNDIAPTKKTSSKKDERTWFQKGAFDDGYQFGDVTKTILGSSGDVKVNIGQGIIGMGEKALDGLMMLGATMNRGKMMESANNEIIFNGLTGNASSTETVLEKYEKMQKDVEESASEFVEKDLYDEKKVADKIIRAPIENIGIDTQNDSVFGAKSDALAQSGGQLLATAGLQAVGVPWWLTTGATSLGGESENALKQGASYDEAFASGLITAGADILTEKLFGAIKFGGKSLDDVLLKPLTGKIANKTFRTLVNLGIDAGGEGFEEVLSGAISNLGTALYKEENVGELLFSEEATDEYIESFIGGFVLGGVSGGAKTIKDTIDAKKQPKLTDNEKKVVEAVVESRVAEAETDGKKLSSSDKKKIQQEVQTELEKGYIDIDTIESALGGETFTEYKAMTDEEAVLQEKIAKLEQGKTIKERKQLLHAKKKLETLQQDTVRSEKKAQLEERLHTEVEQMTASDTFLRESYAERTRKGQKFEADLTKYTGKGKEVVQKAIESGKMNNTTRTHDFVDFLAKVSTEKGIEFDFTDNVELQKLGLALEGKTINGYAEGNSVTLNLQSQKALNKVVGHEITHMFEDADGHLDADLVEAVKRFAETKGEWQSRYDALSKMYEGVENANIENELVADVIGDYLFTDSDFVNQLSVEKPNVFKRIYEEIKHLLKLATSGSKEARELEKVKRTFEKIYRDAKVNSSENMQLSMSDKTTAEGVDVKTEDIDNGGVLGDNERKLMDSYGMVNTHLSQVVEGDQDVRLQQDDRGRSEGDSSEGVSEGYGPYRGQFEEGRYIQGDSGVSGELLTYERFSRALDEAIATNKNGAMVDPHSAEELRKSGTKAFLSDDGMTGVAVEKDGNITAVFKNPRSKYKSVTDDLMITAISEGGTKLDCFVTKGKSNLAQIYSRYGFVPVARMDFDPSIMENWDTEAHGEPDVVFWYHNGEPVETVIEKRNNQTYRRYSDEELSQLPTFTDYGEALAYRDKVQAEAYSKNKTPDNGVFFDEKKFSLSDSKYSRLAENPTKNEKKLRKMVEAEARRHGFTERVMHGTSQFGFTKLKSAEADDGISFFATSSMDTVETYSGVRGTQTIGKEGESKERSANYDLYANTDGFLVLECKGQNWADIQSDLLPRLIDAPQYMPSKGEYNWNTRAVSRYAKDQGYRGVLFKNLLDDGGLGTGGVGMDGGDIYNFFYPQEQVKSADLVTYDANGDVIPLSQRFNVANDDMRYSLSEDTEGEQIAPTGEWNVYGKDITLEAPVQESVPQEAEQSSEVTETADEFAPITETAPTSQYEAIEPRPRENPEYTEEEQEWADNKMSRADIPPRNDGKTQRRWVGTSTESEVVNREILPDDLDQSAIYYEPISNKTTLNKANGNLDRMGYDTALNYFNAQIEAKSVKLEDVALGERLLQEAMKKGDTKTAGELIQNIAILGTELGQKVQALSIIQRMTPEGQLKMLQKIVNRGKAKGDKAFEGVEITQEMIDKILATYGKDGTYNQDTLNDAVEDVKQEIAKQMKVTAMDKVNAWRYLSMLGNPKTHIRNLVSNVFMTGTMRVKDALARTIETVAPIKERTKTWKKASEEVQKYASDVTKEMQEVLTSENGYSEDASIKAKRKTFKSKILQSVYEFNNDLLTKEDWWFKKSAFRRSFQEYLTANGIRTQEDIKNNPKLVEKAKNYAIEQAQISTFQQYSWLANKISEIERKNVGTQIGVGATLPFKKTPINIAKTGLAYSPLGFAKTLTYDIVQVKKGNMQASELIDHIAQNTVGSALVYAGYMLAMSGFLNGGGEDDKESKYDYQLGEQSYSLSIDGNTYSLSWLSPVAMPLFIGANAYEMFEQDKELTFDTTADALAKTLDPMSEMSFLSSLDSVLSSYDSGMGKFKGIGEAMLQNYVTQFVPTLSSQFATVLDDKKRDTKVSADSEAKIPEQTLKKLIYKIPWLRETLEPSTDIWGNEVKQTEDVLARAFETFIAPYSRKESIATEIDEEIKDLYSETGDDGLIPKVPSSTVKYEGATHKMSAKEYTDYKKTYGETAFDLLEDLFKTTAYKKADADEKAEMVGKVYDYARDTAKMEYLEKEDVEYAPSSKYDHIKSAIEYDMTLDEFDMFNKSKGKYYISKAIGGFETYETYTSTMNDIVGDKNANGNTINGSRKAYIENYINGLPLDYGQKILLFTSQYPKDKTYKADVLEYLKGRSDITYNELVEILKELNYTVYADGTVRW